MIKHNPLKLLAKSLEDLLVFSTYLQDALLPITAMSYDERKKVFSILADRFCWEHNPISIDDNVVHHRVPSALQFHHVQKIRHKNFPKIDDPYHHRILNLLSIKGEEGLLHLIFSGGPEMCLEIEELEGYLGDLDHPYPAFQRPEHPLRDDSAVSE